MIAWLRDIPGGSWIADKKHVAMKRSVFDRLSDYTRSSPTEASPGRVWKKDLHWSGPPSNWFAYVADRDKDGVFYFGRPVLLIDDEILDGTP